MATTSPLARLAQFINIESSTDGCWNWLGARSSQGSYPGFWVDGNFVYAHRFAYEQAYGEIPAGFHVHHSCGNRACVRPEHLIALSPEEHRARHSAELARRRAERARYFQMLRNTGLTVKKIAVLVGLRPSTVGAYLHDVRTAMVTA